MKRSSRSTARTPNESRWRYDELRTLLTAELSAPHTIRTARVAGFYFGSALILSCIVYHVALLFF